MGEVLWIKFYIDMFDKWKIKKIRRLPSGNDILLIWVMLLAMAGKCNARGMIYITESTPFTEEDLADELDFEVNTIRLALQVFVQYNMISITDDGTIFVVGWEEHQNTDRLAEIREYNRLAKQKSRAKQKQLESVNDKSMTSQRCHDTEEEGEEEGDLEEENHSFIHSIAREEENSEDEPVENRESLKLKYLNGTLGKGVVMLSDEQFHDLLDKLSIEEFDKYVSIVAECELSGQRYTKKTHYQAILDMVRKDRKIKPK